VAPHNLIIVEALAIKLVKRKLLRPVLSLMKVLAVNISFLVYNLEVSCKVLPLINAIKLMVITYLLCLIL
jgi:hypothetical protein